MDIIISFPTDDQQLLCVDERLPRAKKISGSCVNSRRQRGTIGVSESKLGEGRRSLACGMRRDREMLHAREVVEEAEDGEVGEVGEVGGS